MEKKVKKKLNKKGLIVLVLSIYLLVMVIYYCINLPCKLVLVKGNNLITDEEIIKSSKITNKTKLFSISNSTIKKNIKQNKVIDTVKVTKYITGKIIIDVKELDILYYKVLDNKYILDNGVKTESLNTIGVPTFVNYVPSDIEKSLIKKLKGVSKDVLYKVSEIEYSPGMKENTIIDKNRFLLRMNDGNLVYINLANINNLNKYEEIYSTLDENAKGVLNLDSSGTNGVVFQTFEFLEKKKEVQNELSE